MNVISKLWNEPDRDLRGIHRTGLLSAGIMLVVLAVLLSLRLAGAL